MIQANSASSRKRILVVDDSQADLTRAKMLLSKTSHWDVQTAHDGPTSLEMIKTQSPDVVVTDLQMPLMNGLELLNAIHQLHPEMPVLIMTSAGSERTAMQCLNQGAASYVPKSELASMLSETVERLLNQARDCSDRNRLLKNLQYVEYEIGNDLHLIRALVQDLSNLLKARKRFEEIECLRISTATDEALLNAYYHGNLEVSSELRDEDSNEFYDLAEKRLAESPFRDRRIGVKIRFSSSDVTIAVEDEGNGFDSAAICDPTEDCFLERPHGRGILLMRTFMDEVRFNSRGNQVQMVKRVKQKALDPVTG